MQAFGQCVRAFARCCRPVCAPNPGAAGRLYPCCLGPRTSTIPASFPPCLSTPRSHCKRTHHLPAWPPAQLRNATLLEETVDDVIDGMLVTSNYSYPKSFAFSSAMDPGRCLSLFYQPFFTVVPAQSIRASEEDVGERRAPLTLHRQSCPRRPAGLLNRVEWLECPSVKVEVLPLSLPCRAAKPGGVDQVPGPLLQPRGGGHQGV